MANEKLLAAAIIRQAQLDWQYQERRAKIREFFNSDWGVELCGFVGKCAHAELRKLENGEVNEEEE